MYFITIIYNLSRVKKIKLKKTCIHLIEFFICNPEIFWNSIKQIIIQFNFVSEFKNNFEKYVAVHKSN